MVHIKSEELCDRCAYGPELCMKRWEEDGPNCDGCPMDARQTERSAQTGRFCLCDEITDGIPCEHFREAGEA